MVHRHGVEKQINSQNVPEMVQFKSGTTSIPKLSVKFYRQGASGAEPVRNWLLTLQEIEKKLVGTDIKAVQYGWPLGLPLVDHLSGDIWEVRTRLENRIARVLFAVDGSLIILLHGFIKKDRKTPKSDLDLAKDRWRYFKASHDGK